jgi:hypothetical protein
MDMPCPRQQHSKGATAARLQRLASEGSSKQHLGKANEEHRVGVLFNPRLNQNMVQLLIELGS